MINDFTINARITHYYFSNVYSCPKICSDVFNIIHRCTCIIHDQERKKNLDRKHFKQGKTKTFSGKNK